MIVLNVILLAAALLVGIAVLGLMALIELSGVPLEDLIYLNVAAAVLALLTLYTFRRSRLRTRQSWAFYLLALVTVVGGGYLTLIDLSALAE